MAYSVSVQTLSLLSSNLHFHPASSSPHPAQLFPLANRYKNGESIKHYRAMMVQRAVQGSSAAYAKEMERLSAKESLLHAFKDAGGFGALASGKTTELQRIDVNERIVDLERLSPTPRPTTSPYLEGRWNFEWFGSGSLAFFAIRFLPERLPPELAQLLKVDVVIKAGYTKVAASLKFLNSIESKFIISSKLSVEGSLRMKEEYIEGFLESPRLDEESIPQKLKGALSQAAATVQQLPVPLRDVLVGGMKVPLGGMFERLFMISYLDDEILIIRNTSGIPEVLTRLDPGPPPVV